VTVVKQIGTKQPIFWYIKAGGCVTVVKHIETKQPIFWYIKAGGCVTGTPQNRKIGKPNNLKVFGSNKTKGTKEDNQNQLRSAMPKGGKSTVIL
jgi:hypothetical protein